MVPYNASIKKYLEIRGAFRTTIQARNGRGKILPGFWKINPGEKWPGGFARKNPPPFLRGGRQRNIPKRKDETTKIPSFGNGTRRLVAGGFCAGFLPVPPRGPFLFPLRAASVLGYCAAQSQKLIRGQATLCRVSCPGYQLAVSYPVGTWFAQVNGLDVVQADCFRCQELPSQGATEVLGDQHIP